MLSTQRGLPHHSRWPSVAPCTHRETKVLGSRTTRSGSHPVKAKALRGTMAPPNGPPGFVPKGL